MLNLCGKTDIPIQVDDQTIKAMIQQACSGIDKSTDKLWRFVLKKT